MKYRVQIQQIFGVAEGQDPYTAEWLECDNIKPRSEADGIVRLQKQSDEWKTGAPHRLVKIAADGTVTVIKVVTSGTAYFTPAQQAAIEASKPEFKITFDIPALKIDKLLHRGERLDGRSKVERRIAWNLMLWLQHKGFTVVNIDDGEEDTAVNNPLDAMELIFNLDEVRLEVASNTGGRHTILLVLGNGVDMIADYGYSSGDPDGFDAAMQAFEAEDCE
ncbi:hypothetical protein SKUL_57 [Pseudomonas phage Skulduggery]|uniref:Uncharacterized protein n=1 Tax=Pseudomonas phage Skulduggery TaxID=2006671 RepID=A0A1Y0SZP9_9CAUD|nr:hypothetical protein PP627_gp57 [Pseudomonas phage Skulduggery]ARV77156.1 hypothetical protein SKUL_57 [Pseudomonas phage Skulduggery]